ncbi:MAG: DNA repair protein RecN [Chromatiales bacterium]|jgi:DNA repair protein RecN (Recombination protein N)|nr:DNA repair protein RecN [Chromatiales bacterium]MDX9766341.1 DNA repair protein RecN [Ectothiorhodospiraceae bacterium]
MITHIHIRDFAIIEELELDLAAGMSVLTGETGAGKSILIDAIGLVLGDRADATNVRHGAERAEIGVWLEVTARPEVQAWLAEQDLAAEDECMLRRVIGRDGRSRGFINGRAVTLQAMKELGEMLVDIHGQHEHQSLMRRDVQRQLLDEHAGNETLLSETAALFRHWQDLQQRADVLAAAGSEREARLEWLQFQTRELQALDLGADEWGTLEAEHARLSHAGQLAQTAAATCVALDGDETAIDSVLARVLHELETAERLDAALSEPLDLLRQAQIQMREAKDGLQRYAERLELDPEHLERIDRRIAAAHDLARKHRVRPEELPELRERLEAELADLEGGGTDLEALLAEIERLRQAYFRTAERLSESRRKAAAALGKAVTQTMQELGMQGGRFELAMDRPADERASAHGLDQIEFRVSANPGQPPQALARVASGGELSRIALAIQVILSRGKGIPTLIFDEVDSGVGGAVAEVVGRQLKALGAMRQVLCVTHLPQVAAQADHHLRVQKIKHEQRTQTAIEILDEQARVEELARMLGGVEITRHTLAHAREMRRQSAG